VSVNGFGVREATFGFYFTKLGLPLESALALSFIGAILIMLFSTSGAIAYLARGRRSFPQVPTGQHLTPKDGDLWKTPPTP